MPLRRLVVTALILALAAGATVAQARRAATHAERAGIATTLSKAFSEPRSCFVVDFYRVSTVNPRYALWSGNNRYREPRGCLVGDGFIILKRRADGSWIRKLDAAWDGAPCTRIPARVARDLTRLACG